MQTISFRNFYKFSESTKIELGDITLLVGGNNAGKTTFYKAITFLSHVLKTMTLNHGYTLHAIANGPGMPVVDISKFSDYSRIHTLGSSSPIEMSATFGGLTYKDTHRFEISLVFKDEEPTSKQLQLSKLKLFDRHLGFSFTLSAKDKSRFGTNVEISWIDTSKLKFTDHTKGKLKSNNIDQYLHIHSDEYKRIYDLISRYKNACISETEKNLLENYSENLKRRLSKMHEFWENDDLIFNPDKHLLCEIKENGDFSYPEGLPEILTYISQKINKRNHGLSWKLKESAKSLQAIMNCFIIKKFFPIIDRSEIFTKSSPFFEVIKDCYKHQYSKFGTDLDNSESLINYKELLVSWINKFSIGKDFKVETIKGYDAYTCKILNEEGHWVNLSDLGTGNIRLIEMFLSLLNWYQYPGYIFIEEPEQNLHPALQSKLADFFNEANNILGIQFIIETHSEYLIRKSQLIIAEMKLDNSELKKLNPFKVYYFPVKGIPYNMIYRQDGCFENEFGTGFFDETMNLVFNLI